MGLVLTVEQDRGSLVVRARKSFTSIFPASPNKYKVLATRVRIYLIKIEVNIGYFSEWKVGRCTTRDNEGFR